MEKDTRAPAPRPQKPPQTLLEAIRYFEDEDAATQFVAKLRWPNGPVCPRCQGKEHSYLKSRRLWKCKGCKYQFSVKKGSVFEDSPLGLSKWLPAMWLICNCKNGISSHELGRALGIHQQSAWFMLHRIRLAMRSGTFEKLSGMVEADETYIGGKARNMHAQRRKHVVSGPSGKTAVFGTLERGDKVSKVSAEVIGHARDLQAAIRRHVEPGSALLTDAHPGYRGIGGGPGSDYFHDFVDHATQYVLGQVHVNGLENFWSLLKRGLQGTYVSVESFHLFRYLDEQVYRFNARKGKDADRFVEVLGRTEGRRITYRELTSKN